MLDCNFEIICAAPHHGQTTNQVSAWLDVNYIYEELAENKRLTEF